MSGQPSEHRDAIEHALGEFKGAVAEFPFGPDAKVFKVMGKMFALVDQRNAPGRINLKAKPANVVALESMFCAVHPGYHMNKKHWITVDFGSDADHELIIDWALDSYELVVAGLKKLDRNRLALMPDENG